MNLSKSYEFFQPEKIQEMIHIVGCGSVGSTIAENLVRCGIKRITLWDFDTVEPKNVNNQMFREKDIGRPKTEALKDLLLEINPDIADDIKLESSGWSGKIMSGYIFMAVDSIDIRKQIVQKHMNSPFVKAVFDFRTLLESAQHYAADWSDRKMKQDLLNSMQFSQDEADEEAPVSACGTTLGVATTVRLVCAYGVNNFINFTKGLGLKKYVIVNAFTMDVVAL